MGCGASKSLDYNEARQAVIDKELEKIRRLREESKHVPQSPIPRMKAESVDHNIEPNQGFHHMLIYKPDCIEQQPSKKAEREQATLLAKQKSAMDLIRPKKTANNVSKQGQRAHHLRNVFAKPLQNADVSSFQAPRFDKTEDDYTFLRKAMQKNFIFTNLSERQWSTMLHAFQKVKYEAQTNVVYQGEDGDYFFVVREGKLHYEIDDIPSVSLEPGQSFGELSLLYQSPRAASVVADSDCVLFRVDQQTFRYIMQTQQEHTQHDKQILLEGVPFLKELDETDLSRLADAMIPRRFVADESLVTKGSPTDAFYIVQEGKLRRTEYESGQTRYQDDDIGPGEFFGENALMENTLHTANYFGKSRGVLLYIGREHFQEVLGNLSNLIHKSQDKKKLAAIKIIQKTYLTSGALATLASKIVDRTFPPNTQLMVEGVQTPASLYFVRSGFVAFSRKDGRGHRIVEQGGFFGEDTLTADLNSNTNDVPFVPSKFTVITSDKTTTLGILTLEQFRMVIDTTMIGKGKRTDFTSIVDEDIPLKSLKKHGMLGAGTFGQVWLTSKVAPDVTTRPYALKIQSKYELTKKGQAKGVVRERNIMVQLQSPFIIRLVQTYQDEDFIYMLLGLVQGGELYSVIHPDLQNDGISEGAAKFYAAGVLEGLTYMHRRQIVYRDLKPENILVAYGGYPVIVDLGFAKVVESKTYTLCGTPLYLPPEVILNRGHNIAADHWSWGILIYEMIAGFTPFYADGMDQITLYRFVVQGAFSFPENTFSKAAQKLIRKILIGDPTKRLGSLAGGLDDIFNHPWFSSIDFKALRRKEIKAPWEPKIGNPLDMSKFNNWDHIKPKTKNKYKRLTSNQQEVFQDF